MPSFARVQLPWKFAIDFRTQQPSLTEIATADGVYSLPLKGYTAEAEVKAR